MSGARTVPVSRRALLSLEPVTTHIASLLVHARPEAMGSVRELVQGLRAAEIHDTSHHAKVAVVLEAASDRAIGEAVERLQALPGVIGISIVAHYAESDALLDEEIDDE